MTTASAYFRTKKGWANDFVIWGIRTNDESLQKTLKHSFEYFFTKCEQLSR